MEDQSYNPNRTVEVRVETLFQLYAHAVAFHRVSHGGDDPDNVYLELDHVDMTDETLHHALEEVKPLVEDAVKTRPHNCEEKLMMPAIHMDTDEAEMFQSLLGKSGIVTSESVEVVDQNSPLSPENQRRLEEKVAEVEAAIERGEDIPDIIQVEGENGEMLVLVRTD